MLSKNLTSFLLAFTVAMLAFCPTGCFSQEDTVRFDSIQFVFDTVFLAPDTLIQEEIVYIEYSGIPDTCTTISIAPFAAKNYYSNQTTGFSSGMYLSYEKKIGNWQAGIGLQIAHNKWKNKTNAQWYNRFEKEEIGIEILDSFGIVTNTDTTWQIVSKEYTKNVLDSILRDSTIAEQIKFYSMSVPLSIGYSFGSGFLFGSVNCSIEPGITFNRKTKHQEMPVEKNADIKSTQINRFFCDLYPHCRISYTLTPQWLISANAGFRYRITAMAQGKSTHQSSIIGALSFSYIINADMYY